MGKEYPFYFGRYSHALGNGQQPMVVRPLLALAILGLIHADHGLIRYPCQSMDLAEVSFELGPRIPTVGGAEHLAIYGAGQEEIGIGGMGGQVPNCPIRFHG